MELYLQSFFYIFLLMSIFFIIIFNIFYYYMYFYIWISLYHSVNKLGLDSSVVANFNTYTLIACPLTLTLITS
jgi:hypothetical protein